MTYEEWENLHGEDAVIKFAETGADRELDFDLEKSLEEEYNLYIKKNESIIPNPCLNIKYTEAVPPTEMPRVIVVSNECKEEATIISQAHWVEYCQEKSIDMKSEIFYGILSILQYMPSPYILIFTNNKDSLNGAVMFHCDATFEVYQDLYYKTEKIILKIAIG